MSDRWPSKTLVGVTGNIATGKSTIMRLAAGKGALTLDADKVVHEIMDHDQVMQSAIAEAFGGEVRLPDGRIDRRALGAIVFDDGEALGRLEGMIHPAVRERIIRRIGESEHQVVFVEAIHLLKGGLARLCDQIWVTVCPRQCQLDRLVICRGMERETAARRIDVQPPQEEKVARADVVFDTSGTLADTEAQFEKAWRQLGIGYWILGNT